MYKGQTEFLYWNRFPYKLILNASFGNVIRNSKLKEITRIYNLEKPEKYMSGNLFNLIKSNYDNIVAFSEMLEQYPKEDYKFRSEGRNLSLFFKDRKMLDVVLDKFGDQVTAFYEPQTENVLNNLLENRVIIKAKLTHGCRYKIFLKGSFLKINDNIRQSLIRILSGDGFFNVKNVLEDLRCNRNHLWTQYIYAKDSKNLMLLQMVGNDIIRETVKIMTYEEAEEEKNNAK